MVAIKKTDMWDDIIKLKSFSADKLIQDMDKIETLFDIIMKGPQKNFVKERIFDWNDVVDRVIDMSINSNSDRLFSMYTNSMLSKNSNENEIELNEDNTSIISDTNSVYSEEMKF